MYFSNYILYKNIFHNQFNSIKYATNVNILLYNISRIWNRFSRSILERLLVHTRSNGVLSVKLRLDRRQTRVLRNQSSAHQTHPTRPIQPGKRHDVTLSISNTAKHPGHGLREGGPTWSLPVVAKARQLDADACGSLDGCHIPISASPCFHAPGYINKRGGAHRYAHVPSSSEFPDHVPGS